MRLERTPNHIKEEHFIQVKGFILYSIDTEDKDIVQGWF